VVGVGGEANTPRGGGGGGGGGGRARGGGGGGADEFIYRTKFRLEYRKNKIRV